MIGLSVLLFEGMSHLLKLSDLMIFIINPDHALYDLYLSQVPRDEGYRLN